MVEFEKIVYKPDRYDFRVRPAFLFKDSLVWLTVEYCWRSHRKVFRDRALVDQSMRGVKYENGRIVEVPVWLGTPLPFLDEVGPGGTVLFDSVTVRLEVDLYADNRTFLYEKSETFQLTWKDRVLKWLI